MPPLRIAIIGGGPGGLGAAIALSKLEDVEVTVYEQARELREIGAGIRIGFNCWTVLGLLGVESGENGVNGHVKDVVEHRNGLSGTLLYTKHNTASSPYFLPQRTRRTNLQSALMAVVPLNTIKLGKKLVSMVEKGEEVVLTFADGGEVIADLVVGGDGIRSVIRQTVFPTHEIAFTGTTIFRTLIPLSTPISLASNHLFLKPSVQTTTWWYGPAGHVYTSPVDSDTKPVSERKFEIAARSVIDPKIATEKKFSWGVDVTNERVESFFENYDPALQALLKAVPAGGWREFSAFAGPRLNTLTAWNGKIVLIGDASHPLSGAFGSGAAFALEDGWVLAKAIEHARANAEERRDVLRRAGEMFDEVRSPYYKRMYEYLDSVKQKMLEQKIASPDQSFEESLNTRLTSQGEDALGWVYGNHIEKVWAEYVAGNEERNSV